MAMARTRGRRPSRTPARRPTTASTDGKPNRRDIYAEVTDKIVVALEAGTVPWRRPWKLTGGGSIFPLSMSSGKPYRGVNIFLLGIEALTAGYASPWWGTYDKIAALSGMVRNESGRWESPDGTPRGVRQGEKSSLAVFWKRIRVTETNPDTGEDESRMVPMLRVYRVFNACQAGQLPARFYPAAPGDAREPEPGTAPAALLAGYLERNPSLTFTHANPDRAYYQWGADTDLVNVPPLGSYPSEAAYWSTGFHELAHSTGHASRLKRHAATGYDCRFGSPDYSREELVAEMGAAMLNAVTGNETPELTGNSAAYIASWIGKLRGDTHLAVNAAANAQRAADYVQGVTWSEDENEGEAAA